MRGELSRSTLSCNLTVGAVEMPDVGGVQTGCVRALLITARYSQRQTSC